MEQKTLTSGEWYVMRELWAESPQTLMQLVSRLTASVGWAKSTTITTLRRMEGKGLVSVGTSGRGKTYAPLVAQEEATVEETRSFLDRVYHGSMSLMLTAMAEHAEFSDEELRELRAILTKAEERRHD